MSSKEFVALQDTISDLKLLIQSQSDKTTVPEEILINSDQMERLLKCSPSTLYRLRKKGVVPCVVIGGRYYYLKNYFTREVINQITKHDPSQAFDD
jgi:ribonuclease D